MRFGNAIDLEPARGCRLIEGCRGLQRCEGDVGCLPRVCCWREPLGGEVAEKGPRGGWAYCGGEGLGSRIVVGSSRSVSLGSDDGEGVGTVMACGLRGE